MTNYQPDNQNPIRQDSSLQGEALTDGGSRAGLRTSQEIKRALEKVDLVVSVGSVDGVCTTAAVLRHSQPGTEVQFCQAFTVNTLKPEQWGSERKVLLVDLAVNNRDQAMTVDFLNRVSAAGHSIVGILDEHNAADWDQALSAAGINRAELAIQPVSQNEGEIQSSGALLRSLLQEEMDSHTSELC